MPHTAPWHRDGVHAITAAAVAIVIIIIVIQHTPGKGENLISRGTTLDSNVQKNHKTYKETGKCGAFKGKNNQQKVSLKKT